MTTQPKIKKEKYVYIVMCEDEDNFKFVVAVYKKESNAIEHKTQRNRDAIEDNQQKIYYVISARVI